MKVKITYTVDLKDVPSKADPLIEDARLACAQVADRLASLQEIKDTSVERSLKEIEEIRNMLMNVDLALDDCDSMLAGYLHAVTDPNVHQPTPPQGELEDG